jgi:sodium-dependent dicarboxylate transporter 2/3/5
MVESIPFSSWSPFLTIIGAGLLCVLMSTFISNTATASLLVPILAAVGTAMGPSLAPFGGITTLLIGIAISASLAMALPISTPPNALAHSTGLVRQGDMAKVGIIIGIVGMILGYLLLFFCADFLFH